MSTIRPVLLVCLGVLVAACGADGSGTAEVTSSTGGDAGTPTTSSGMGAATETGGATTAGETTGGATTGAPDPSAGESGSESSSSGGEPPPEEQPPPAEGAGVSDPPTNTLHNHGCGGVDWQRIHGWLLLPYAAPELGPADEIQRCVDRYAGWVTNEADAAGVSRASVYAGLAASGQCDADSDYDGALIPGSLCVGVHPELSEAQCLAQMAATRAFGISTLAQVLAHPDAIAAHERDVPRMGAYLGDGAVACGGEDRWRLTAPAGFVDRYVAAYNAYKGLSSEVPACSKRIVLTVALYTGMDDPGAEGVTTANGCWTYERVAKNNAEWKICIHDGSVIHPGGVKWVYDDTNTNHNQATEKARILDCQAGVPGRGYVYMTNRGDGWPKVVTEGVAVHFAEVYSGQFAVDDQFGLWKSLNKPGDPMVHFGEATTTASKIKSTAAAACAEVADGGNLGVYVYPESLRTGRMGALVQALNDCTAG